jgi:hypothetical protein
MPVARPVWDMVAADSLDELHTTSDEISRVERSSKVPTAEYCLVSPATIFAASGVTWMLTRWTLDVSSDEQPFAIKPRDNARTMNIAIVRLKPMTASIRN